MIVFNVYAIVVLLFIAVVVGPIVWLFPNVAETPIGQISLAAIATVIAGISEAGGLQGRLFWIPMWVLGIIAMLGLTFINFSWVGIGVLAGIIVGLFGVLMLVVYLVEKSDWTNAPRALSEAQKINNTSDPEFWEEVKKAFFIPSMMNYTKEMCENNGYVIGLLENNQVEWELLPQLKEAMAKGFYSEGKIEVDEDLTAEFELFLEEKIESFNPEAEVEVAS